MCCVPHESTAVTGRRPRTPGSCTAMATSCSQPAQRSTTGRYAWPDANGSSSSLATSKVRQDGPACLIVWSVGDAELATGSEIDGVADVIHACWHTVREAGDAAGLGTPRPPRTSPARSCSSTPPTRASASKRCAPPAARRAPRARLACRPGSTSFEIHGIVAVIPADCP